MKTTTKQHGGARPGSGRKPLDESGSVMYSIRLTQAQRAKLDSIGGAARLRKFIDKCKEIA